MRRTWKWTSLLAGMLLGTTTGGTAAAQLEEPVEAEPAPEAVPVEAEVEAPPPVVEVAPPPPPAVEPEPVASGRR